MKFRAFFRGIPYLAWAVVFVALCWGLFAAILGAVTPELRAELGNYERLGMLMMLWAGGNVVGAIQGGRLAAMHPPRTLFLVYCTVAAIALACIVSSQSFGLLGLGFFVIALAESALVTLGHSILADVYTEPVARARVLSLVDVAWSVGNLITPGVVIGLHQWSDSWRLPYLLFFAPLALAMLAFAPRKVFAGVQHTAQASPAPLPSEPQGYAPLLRIKTVTTCMVAGLLTGYIEWGQYFWYVSYGIQAQSLDANAARFGLQWFVAGMFAVRCWQAFVHSNLGLGQKLWRLNVLALAGLGAAVVWPHHGQLALYSASNLLFGMGEGVEFPILLAVMMDVAPAQSSRLSALLMISVTVGAQLAGYVIGRLADHLGMPFAYGSLAVAALAFTAAIWPLRNHGQGATKAN